MSDATNSQEQELNELISNKSLKVRQNVLEKLVDTALKVVVDSIDYSKNDDMMREGHLMLQLAVLRSISILTLSSGISHKSPIGDFNFRTHDTSSMFTILRSVFETFCTFNNIFCESKSTDESILKYNLWEVAGLKNRQSVAPFSDENKAKKLQEEEQIKALKLSIDSNPIFLRLDAQSKKNVRDAIKNKNYQVMVNGPSASVKGWQVLFEQAGVKRGMDHTYTILTANSHPSKISLMQFGIREEKTLIENTSLILTITASILSFFLADYMGHLVRDKDVLKDIPAIDKGLVIMYNRMFRDIMHPESAATSDGMAFK